MGPRLRRPGPGWTAARAVLLVAGLLVGLALAGCAGPSRSYDDYTHKAANTAEAAGSEVQTARLAVDAAVRHRAFGPYLSVLLGRTETELDSIQSTFGSVQPPDQRSDALRSKLGDLLSQAADVLADLRIAVRRGRLDQLGGIAKPLPELSRKFDELAQVRG